MPNRPEYQNKGSGHSKTNPGGTSHKGLRRVVQDNKHTEAVARNEATPPERRKNAGTVR